jgi:hypothetical protein
MKKCIEKGLQGKMLNIFKNEIIKENKNWTLIESQFNQVYNTHNILEAFF